LATKSRLQWTSCAYSFATSLTFGFC